MKNKITYLQYVLLKKIFELLSNIPRRLLGNLAVSVGLLWFKLDKRHRDLAIDNISKAFKNELDESGVYKLAKKNFVYLA